MKNRDFSLLSSSIPLIKMQGLGNDFVMIHQCDIPDDIDMTHFTRSIANRELGVGCDQLIIYSDKEESVGMSIYNQDGSQAKACGNASRCLVKLYFDREEKRKINIDVDGYVIQGQYIDHDRISVDMGMPVFQSSWMPNNEDLWSLAERYMIEPKEMVCVDVSNPHLVIFSKLLEKDMNIIGDYCQESQLFPDGVNVNFAKIENDRIFLKVWERGVGFTYACGSGAIATFAAACRLGFIDNNAEIVFSLGSLMMEKSNNSILMTGPASYVFIGEYWYDK